MVRPRAVSAAFRHGPRHFRRSLSQQAPSSPPRLGPRVIFSGIQPTGVPHLGNFLGALQNWVRIQNEATPADRIFFSIVGLHAVTIPQDPKKLREERRDMLATLLAIGLDPGRCCLFHQDQVPAHAELAWLLNCITPVGRLNRMTTWKAKLAELRNAGSAEHIDDSMLHLGLLAYPVLQAADILLYKTTHVPVGEDQLQHIELTRVIASLFNKQFRTKSLVIPDHVITPQARVLNLRDARSKMSKSNPDPMTRILLTDPPDQIKKKLQRAVTDSIPHITYDPVSRPAVSNLLSIYAGMSDPPTSPEEVAARFEGKMASDLKSELVEVVSEGLRPFRERFTRLQADSGYLAEVEKAGREKAAAVADQTLLEAKTAMGLA